MGVKRKEESRIMLKCGGKFSESRTPGGLGGKWKEREQSWWWQQAWILYQVKFRVLWNVESVLQQRLRIEWSWRNILNYWFQSHILKWEHWGTKTGNDSLRPQRKWVKLGVGSRPYRAYREEQSNILFLPITSLKQICPTRWERLVSPELLVNSF